MKYIIMADGDMKRWYAECSIPKHLLKVGDETLLKRQVRQLKSIDPEAEIIITSHSAEYEVPGATRYEPKNNHLEIDRFTWELIGDDTCFLYGDTFYTDEAMKKISETGTDGLHFMGTEDSIVAVMIGDGELFRRHISRVKELFLSGKIGECRGWQVYQSYADLPFGQPVIGSGYTLIDDETCGFNTLSEYRAFLEKGL